MGKKISVGGKFQYLVEIPFFFFFRDKSLSLIKRTHEKLRTTPQEKQHQTTKKGDKGPKNKKPQKRNPENKHEKQPKEKHPTTKNPKHQRVTTLLQGGKLKVPTQIT